MNTNELFDRARGGLVAGTVFGEPVERDGVTVIPVAMFVGGGGGGSTRGEAPASADAQTGSADGGGFGGVARGIGVFTVSNGQVRFVPATDRTLLALVALLVWGRVMLRIVRNIRHRATS